MGGAGLHRLRWERVVWVADMVAYLLLGIGGLTEALSPSRYVVSVAQVDWLILGWGAMLAVGGLVAFLGRLLRNWAIEYTANVLAGWGTVLYAAMLVPAVVRGEQWALFSVVMVAWLFMVRRHAEMHIFTTEPGLDSFRKRLDAALRRRTRNTVPREHY